MHPSSRSSPGRFADRRQGLEFWLLCLATFCCFTTLSQTSLLAVLMTAQGTPLPAIGMVLSSYGVAVIFCSLASGIVANRLGTLRTLRLGMFLLLAAHLSYHLTLSSVPLAMASRLLQGIGFGLFLAPAMVYAHTRVSPSHQVHLIGIFASMIQLPNAVGPPLAKFWLDHFGPSLFFPAGAVPALIAVLLTCSLREPVSVRQSQEKLPLLPTVQRPGMGLPLSGILVTGAMLGLVSSYLAPLLIQKQVPIALFFTVFPVTAFSSRFLLLGILQSWPRRHLLIFAFAAMAAAYALLIPATGTVSIALLAMLFGLGASLSYPLLSTWVSGQFTPAQQATPIALFNAFFNFGLFLTPLSAAYLIAWGGYACALGVLAGASLVVCLALARNRAG